VTHAASNTSAFNAQPPERHGPRASFTLPSGFDGERNFWIKAIASPGIYSNDATFVSTVVAQPQNANLLVTIVLFELLGSRAKERRPS